MNYLDNRLPSRFWDKTTPEPNSGCWLWTGAQIKGYGQIMVKESRWVLRRAHRVSYEALVGKIQPGLQIDHKCQTESCVNPQHLQPVTLQTNRQLASSRKQFCKRNHPLFGANLRERPQPNGKVYRACKECNK